MCDNPITLVDLCLDLICERLDEVFEIYEESPDSQNPFDVPPRTFVEKKVRFRDNDMFLFNRLSEQLLYKLGVKHQLNDATLGLFTEKHTRLKSVRIKNARKVTFEGLKILRQHKISDLECINLRNICISKILECLGKWSIKNLTHLNLSNCTFIDMSRYSLMVQLTNLRNLRSLNVSYTEFNQQTLQLICEDLHFLEKLDVSGTCVKDLKPLLLLKDRLISLTATDLKNINMMSPTIVQLEALKHLDISLINEKFETYDNNIVNVILQDPKNLPELVSLEISGWREIIDQDKMEIYLEAHPKLRYLGIVLNSIAFEILFSEPNNHDLVVAGLGNLDQIKVALKRHYERPSYVQKALYHLFQLTTTFSEARPDIFELVLPAMAAHPTKFGVQMAATACLYNLTRGELSKSIHPKLLSKGVHLTLNAMEYFPDEYQLQKNSLLILCSDRILQEVQFERYRCAKLVLDSLCAFEELNMNRMAVAICSILAAKVSTTETSKLGAKAIYMRKLLSMVQSRIETKQSDITMKFTLSALWNLTDESAMTCTVFLEQGGANLFLEVLKTFKNEGAIETKVLGLLNNIAEVEWLRNNLMINALVEELFSLLKSEHIDVSYFAAGIVAHLASDGPEKWTATNYTRTQMLEELRTVVLQWKVPDSEMVAYRSFRPFFPLLRPDMDYQVQLWAVWAIHHVCTKNPKRYCLMLREERGNVLLKDLLTHDESHPYIGLISQILETLETNVV